MMVDDLSAFYDVANGDAELVQVQGITVPALFEETSEVVLGEMLTTASTLRMPATVAAAEGGSCTVRGTRHFVIRAVQPLPPDGREQLLVLAKG